eukprot:365763-Chlamydomonas_euryale.AAC.33
MSGASLKNDSGSYLLVRLTCRNTGVRGGTSARSAATVSPVPCCVTVRAALWCTCIPSQRAWHCAQRREAV